MFKASDSGGATDMSIRLLAITAGAGAFVFLGAGSIPVAIACDGDACGSFTIVGKRILNKDHKYKIHVVGCIHTEINAPIVGTICSIDGKFDIIVDPDKARDIEKATITSNFRIDISRALLMK
jgi:hypothetical protein